jgi:hypothetical protein
MKIFELQRKGTGKKLQVTRVTKQGLWLSLFKTNASQGLDIHLNNDEALALLIALNKDLKHF